MLSAVRTCEGGRHPLQLCTPQQEAEQGAGALGRASLQAQPGGKAVPLGGQGQRGGAHDARRLQKSWGILVQRAQGFCRGRLCLWSTLRH